MKTKMTKATLRSKDLVYYGPHPCKKCGGMIVKAGNGASEELQFNFTHDSQYPNHTWKRHKC